jgi:hypothetical protein
MLSLYIAKEKARWELRALIHRKQSKRNDSIHLVKL